MALTKIEHFLSLKGGEKSTKEKFSYRSMITAAFGYEGKFLN